MNTPYTEKALSPKAGIGFFFAVACCFSLCGQTAAPLVQHISASAASDTQIIVQWELPSVLPSGEDAIAQIILYRNTKPITTRKDIAGSVLIARLSPDEKHYTDTVSDYAGYYYAAVVRTAGGTENQAILPSLNATVTEAKALKQPQVTDLIYPDTPAYPSGMRRAPLPYLNMVPGMEQRLRRKEAAGGFPKNLGNDSPQPMEPYIFKADSDVNSVGDDYLLRRIIEATFEKEDYVQAEQELTGFLQLNRSGDTADRARFYLGQCCYFTGNYRAALFYFLQIQESFPAETRRWISESLEAYNIERKL